LDTVPGLLHAVAAVLLLASAQEGSPLFVLGRNKNANVVEYSVRARADGRLEGDAVDAHWLLRAEDGRRAELNFFERLLAYGVHVQLGPGRDNCDLRIVSLPTRHIRVRRGAAGYEANTLIGGVPARLQSIFVTAEDGSGWPRVLSVELRGERLADGAPAYEKIVP
jgi:hypothetical protein